MRQGDIIKLVHLPTAGHQLCLAEAAANPWTRAVGPLSRKGLPEGRGLCIRPCKSIPACILSASRWKGGGRTASLKCQPARLTMQGSR
jgi:hypothetical protein